MQESRMLDRPYWWDTVSLSGMDAATGAIDGRFDVAIVGGGYTGLSAARALARAGARVVVFEQDQIAAGASSRNAGQVLTGLRLDAQTLLRRYGEIDARALFDASTAAMQGLERLIVEE